MRYIDIIRDSFAGYWNYLVQEITNPGWINYFYWLLGLSVAVWMLEAIFPWRKKQSILRKDFWLDGFYMFFNFFIFSLIGYNALSNVAVNVFNDLLAIFKINNIIALEISNWPILAQFVFLFILVDFIQWNVHRLLHRVPFLWQFHKVHHSVKEMGFAAHLRFHWMETIVYKTIQYIPVAMIGFGIQEFFVVHIIALLIGHLNHANVGWDYGLLRYAVNNPKMHIWHHAKELPAEHPHGMNFGISLSIWDYIFKTAYLPRSGKEVELGFKNDNTFPKGFIEQMLFPFKSKPK